MSEEIDEEDPLLHRNRAADLERIRQARKKRVVQLKTWQQYDRQMEKNKVRSSSRARKSKVNSRRIYFHPSIILLEAAAREDIDEVRQILANGGSPNACNEDGLTALHQSCIDNSFTMCRLLLEFKADVNAKDSESWTPLHASAACAHTDVCACLIDSGADLLALNAEGNMPYDICEEENTLDLIENAMAVRGVTQVQIDKRRKEPELRMLADVREFAASSGDFGAFDSQGATLLHVAASCGYLDVARFILERGITIDIHDRDGWRPIHVAACWGQLEFIEFMLLRGADIDCTTTSGESVYEICEDMEMNRRLQIMKEDIDRKFELTKSLEIKPNLTSSGRRSNSSKRSASIRRSSMREKSLMSWKEARQEALLRDALHQKIDDSTNPVTAKLTSSQDGSTPLYSSGGQDLHTTTNGPDSIDMSQVMLDVQLATEAEISTRAGGLIRRGSSRNSFTHSHPYHSPSRDPSLLDQVVPEEETIPVAAAQPPQPLKRTQTKPPFATAQPETDKTPLVDPTFIRNCDPNVSIVRPKQHPPAANSHVTVKLDLNNNRRPRPPQKDIDAKQVSIKAQKVQGCCLVM